MASNKAVLRQQRPRGARKESKVKEWGVGSKVVNYCCGVDLGLPAPSIIMYRVHKICIIPPDL
jgi:hypothetical protein